MRRNIDARLARLALQPAARERVAGRALPRADQGDQRARRGGVLDDAAPGGGQPEHLPQPVGDDLLDFGEGRARLPGQSEDAEASADQIAKNARRQRIGGEIAEEARDAAKATAPAGPPCPDRRSRRRSLPVPPAAPRATRREPRRFGRGHDRPPAHAFVVVGEPVDQPMAIAAEFFRRHMGRYSLRKERGNVQKAGRETRRADRGRSSAGLHHGQAWLSRRAMGRMRPGARLTSRSRAPENAPWGARRRRGPRSHA